MSSSAGSENELASYLFLLWMKIRKKEFFYIPNLLTYLRFILLFFIFYFLSANTHKDFITAMALIIIAVTSDLLDGYLARRLNQISDLGKLLDPVVDKIGIAVFGIYVVLYKDFPLWAVIAVIFKDILLVSGSFYLVTAKKKIPVSDRWGKWSAFIWALTILTYILELNFVKEIFLILALLLLIISGINYAVVFRKSS